MVNNEAGTLSFLRHQPIKEIKRDDFGRNVNHRADVLPVNRDVVLLIGVKRLVARRLRDLDFFGWRIYRTKFAGAIGGEIEKCAYEQSRNGDWSNELHGIKHLTSGECPLEEHSTVIQFIKARQAPDIRPLSSYCTDTPNLQFQVAAE